MGQRFEASKPSRPAQMVWETQPVTRGHRALRRVRALVPLSVLGSQAHHRRGGGRDGGPCRRRQRGTGGMSRWCFALLAIASRRSPRRGPSRCSRACRRPVHETGQRAAEGHAAARPAAFRGPQLYDHSAGPPQTVGRSGSSEVCLCGRTDHKGRADGELILYVPWLLVLLDRGLPSFTRRDALATRGYSVVRGTIERRMIRLPAVPCQRRTARKSSVRRSPWADEALRHLDDESNRANATLADRPRRRGLAARRVFSFSGRPGTTAPKCGSS